MFWQGKLIHIPVFERNQINYVEKIASLIHQKIYGHVQTAENA